MNTRSLIKLLLIVGSIHITLFSNGQNVKYLGRVIDSETQKPIPNANVILKDSTTGTFTNFLGYFEIIGSIQEIVVSHIGYEKVSFSLNVESAKFQLSLQPIKYSLQALKSEYSKNTDNFNYNKDYYSQEVILRSQESSPLEIPAEFPGGLKEFHSFIEERLLELSDSITNPIDVKINFSILANGSLKVDSIREDLSHIKILKEIFENSPNWIPAYQRHSEVATSFEQPLIFESKNTILSNVELQPEYSGGIAAFYSVIRANMSYPNEAMKNKIEGRVYVSFVINQSGELEYVNPEKSLGYGCDEEAVRLVQLTTGKWIPGSQNGRPVKVRMVLPIIFRL